MTKRNKTKKMKRKEGKSGRTERGEQKGRKGKRERRECQGRLIGTGFFFFLRFSEKKNPTNQTPSID